MPTEVGVLALALLVSLHAAAQAPPQRIAKVGFCGGFGDRTHVFHKAFEEGMRKRGWVDGRNLQILIPERPITPDGVASRSCDEYMADKELDVIVDGRRHDDPTYKVPIVGVLNDVLGTPLATSPSRKITGLSIASDGISATDKMMALLKEAVGAENIFLLYATPPGPGAKRLEEPPPPIREAALKLGVKVHAVVFTKFEDFEPAFRMMAATPRGAAIFYQGMYWYKIISGHKGVDWYIHKHRLPVMMRSPDWVQTMDAVPFGYGLSMIEMAERKSHFVDRILRGAKPADLPFEQLAFRFGINVDAAKLYGITIPSSVLLQADIVVPPHPKFDWAKPPPPGKGGLEP